ALHDWAIADLDVAIANKPDYAEAYLARARARLATGLLDDAEADLSEAIKINADYYDAYIVRNLVYDGKHLYSQAIEDATKAIAMKPYISTGYNSRAW